MQTIYPSRASTAGTVVAQTAAVTAGVAVVVAVGVLQHSFMQYLAKKVGLV